MSWGSIGGVGAMAMYGNSDAPPFAGPGVNIDKGVLPTTKTGMGASPHHVGCWWPIFGSQHWS